MYVVLAYPVNSGKIVEMDFCGQKLLIARSEKKNDILTIIYNLGQQEDSINLEGFRICVLRRNNISELMQKPNTDPRPLCPDPLPCQIVKWP